MKTVDWEKYVWPILALLAIVVAFLFALDYRYQVRVITCHVANDCIETLDTWTGQLPIPHY